MLTSNFASRAYETHLLFMSMSHSWTPIVHERLGRILWDHAHMTDQHSSVWFVAILVALLIVGENCVCQETTLIQARSFKTRMGEMKLVKLKSPAFAQKLWET